MRDAALKKNAIFIAVAAVIALFARTAAFSFIGLDDAAYTFRNPFVAGGLSLNNAVEAFANLRHGGIWMPVTYISYMADASFCSMTNLPLIGWMHLGNVLIHAINFLLLYLLLRMLVGRDSVGVLIAALLWAIHPLRAEPVAWIAARKELLWSLFAIAGLLFWARSFVPSGGRNRLCIACAYLFCALSCLSKPTAMCFPLLAWFVEWRIRNSFRWREAARYIPLLLMSGATAAIAAYSQTHVAGQEAAALYSVPFVHRIVNALSSLGFYLRKTILPAGLHVDCRAVQDLCPLDGAVDMSVLAVAAFFVLLCLTKVKATFGRREILFDLGWLFVSLGPTLGLFGSFGIEAHADRFFYLPSMAFAFAVAAFFPLKGDTVAKGASFIALVAFSAVTFRQLGFWRDDGTAYRRTMACDPGHPRAMVHVADADCARRRDFDSGIALYRKALSCAYSVPSGGFDVADVNARLAYALSSRGRHEDFAEIKSIGASVLNNFRLDRRGMMLDALGTAFMYDGDWKRAALLFQASIDAPARFWPKASTRRKLEECQERMK